VRVLPSTATQVLAVSDDVLQFRQSTWFERLLRFSSLTSHPLPEHLYGDRLKRVDERTLSRRRGPIAQFSVAKK
jgi:hypothetical protein